MECFLRLESVHRTEDPDCAGWIKYFPAAFWPGDFAREENEGEFEYKVRLS